MSALLEVTGLTVRLPVEGQLRTVLRDVSLSVNQGEVLGLVGESGSGKSMTARSIMRLLPAGADVSGSVRFHDHEVLSMTKRELRALRTRDVSMVFQDPHAHINPVRRLGDFLAEPLTTNQHVARAEALSRSARILRQVGIPDAERRLRQYPHEISGGMLQRVMIASTLLSESQLILADEPTTALDVTTQSEVMGLLQEISDQRDLALIFITHDLELARAVCDRIAVMYAGQIVEVMPASTIHDRALHPYTKALMASRPSLDRRLTRMPQISGRPLSAYEAPDGCPFQSRCPHVVERCAMARPELRLIDGVHVRCIRAEELRGWVPAEVAPATDEPAEFQGRAQ
jgi:oligopeptide/dipeptide ABC transporter ATP-binding protein